MRKYPLYETGDWIWIHAGTKEQMEAIEKPSFYSPWKMDHQPIKGYFDLEIDSSLLVENFMDPSHVPFTHDSIGSIGKRSSATALKMNCEFYSNYIKGIPDFPILESSSNCKIPFYYR